MGKVNTIIFRVLGLSTFVVSTSDVLVAVVNEPRVEVVCGDTAIRTLSPGEYTLPA